jgi:RHS repeat-associated protein
VLLWAVPLKSKATCDKKEGGTGFRYQGQYEDVETGLYYNRFRYYDPEDGVYISKDPISISGGMNVYGYVHDPNGWVDIFGLSGTGGAYLFGFASGDKYIGKGEIVRMNQSISTRTSQVGKMGGDNTLIGKAHISTGGNNDLGKMVEYKAMKDAGFRPGGAGVPDGYLNNHMSGKSTWDTNPHLQGKATELADKLRADYDADVKARAKVGCH